MDSLPSVVLFAVVLELRLVLEWGIVVVVVVADFTGWWFEEKTASALVPELFL